jgi:hypothetical protein
MSVNEFAFSPSPRTLRLLKAMAICGAATLLAGAAIAPQRTWGNLLLMSYFIVCLGLAGLFFVALQYACNASWAVALRRIPEAMSATLPFGAAGLAVVFALGSSIYPWAAGGHAAGFQRFWLQTPFFLARAAFYVLLWVALGIAIVQTSRRQDRDGDVRHTHRNVRLSLIFLVIFAVSFWLASFDWIMSLEPAWSSTIFGIYNFAGLFSSGLAAMILLVLWLRRAGPLRDFVNEEHLHDLGKLLFAFSTFWMYIWFSQYMLIWYADITDETAYFVRRLHQAWGPLFSINMILNWVVPFTVLLSRNAKRNPGVLAKVAAVVLVGRWLDLYLMILPPLSEPAPRFGLWEIGAMAGGAGLFLLVFVRSIGQAPLVPMRDPHLIESLHYHN